MFLILMWHDLVYIEQQPCKSYIVARIYLAS